MKVFDASKTRMTGLPYGEKNYDNMLSRFHLILERYGQTDRQTDKWTEFVVYNLRPLYNLPLRTLYNSPPRTRYNLHWC